MHSFLKPGWLLAAALGVMSPTVLQAETPPDAPASEADPFAGHEWELTPYLKGTAPQIRDKMNGETERLILRIKESRKTIHDAGISVQDDEKAALDKVHKSTAYKQTAADKAKAEADLDAARKSGTSEERVEASGRFNKARTALEQIEHDGVINDADLSRDRHAKFDAERELKRYTESLSKATAWRDELLDATRNGFMLRGPLAEGSKGTLPRVTIEKIVDADQVQVGFDLVTFDMSKPGKDKEGIKQYNATKSRVHMLASGVPTDKLKIGDKLSLDRVFIVERTKKDERDGVIYEVKPSPADADKLFEMIVPLRESLPPEAAKSPKGY